MKKKISIIDYGAGNILSVIRAFNVCDVSVEVLTDPKKINDSSYLVLPGDGSFSFASKELKKKNFFDLLIKHYKKGNPLLGICLGMQMLMSRSEEFGNNSGLSIIKGKIKKIKRQKKIHLKIPVIGWHSINTKVDKDNSQFLKLNRFNNKRFYFVHSYHAVPANKKEVLASYKYGTENITAIIGKENIIGAQFHPEKSGLEGIKLIKIFLKIN